MPVLRAALIASTANHTPAPPPTTLSSSDSLSVSASIPMKPEPSAPRTASSNCARSARTRNRPATFVDGHEEHEQHAAEDEPQQMRDGADDRVPERLHLRCERLR